MYFKSLLVAGLAAQAAAAPSVSLATTFEERGIDALEKRDSVCPGGSYLLYTDGSKHICVGPLGIAAGIAIWSLAFIPTVILASKGKGCTPTTGAVDKNGKPISSLGLSTQDEVLKLTQADISALDKRDATPDAELSGAGHMSLAPRAETLDSRSSKLPATEVYYSWAASGRHSCSTTMKTSDYESLINDHIGKMMLATGATCGVFTIDNSGTYSLTLKIAYCDTQWCYNGCWSR